MTILEQAKTAEETKAFLSKYGLKRRFVTEICNIPETTFSGFMNGKSALSEKQYRRLVAYTKDYVRRNS